ncbi:Tudor/PWWP/MBT superfamily protein [Abeliophyllum distichum]|uniref:Tudor/PWWP/MBT superfamily protein n=1 Tax=Abeliophyllum distichum TaxID=126358 RepID=A0ABD1RQ60_9LAMI
MSSNNDSGVESSSDGKNDAFGEEPSYAPTSSGRGGASGGVGLNLAGPTEEARFSDVRADRSEETRVSQVSADVISESTVSELKNEEAKFGDVSRGSLQNQASSSTSKVHDSETSKKTDMRKKTSTVVAGYNAMLSAFDEFEGKGKGEAVGHCYEIGDLVWGKVKSHPCWPGHIYNEAFASPSVRRTKHEGQLLVAFFGDSSYGWFYPAELIPFEENFVKKSSQTLSRPFSKAVEEAVDEVSRRRSLGLACRCRNKYNFWPTTVDGYCNVDVGCYESGGVYSRRQIKEAQDSFRPREILNFVQQLALIPLTAEHWTLNFIKNKATVLACRKSFFEAFDETYAQAFGTKPVRPTPPSQPPVVDPAKAALSGRLVSAEALGKGKSSAKHTKTKEQVEKERYLLKRRDERTELKTSKSSSGQTGPSSQPLLVDGLGIPGKVVYSGIAEHSSQTPEPSISEGRELPTSHQASTEDLCKEKLKDDCSGSMEFVNSGKTKAKLHRHPSGDLSTENSVPVERRRKKKRKHEISTEESTDHVQIPAASYIGTAVNNVSGTSVQVLFGEDYRHENQNRNAVGSSPSPTVETMKAVGIGNAVEPELPRLLRDLQASALNPFHGVERSIPAILQKVFLIFRSLVYQKSLSLMAPDEDESKEAHISKLPAVRASASPGETIKELPTGKPPPIRPEDPAKGGQKRAASDRLVESAAKKRKKIDDLKSMAMEKKAVRKVTEIPRDVKETVAKSVTPMPPKANKLQSNKRTEKRITAPEPTMLVMKFPPGGALPSISELKAKFARFGPLEHSGTRVFWTSSTCRLVYQHKIHAEAACKFAVGSNNLFGNANVRCYLRDLGGEAPESESVKVQKDVSVGAFQLKDSAASEQKPAAKTALLSSQQQAQLKSCLKKPPGDESGTSGDRSTASVKFVLGGEESSRVEQLSSNNATHSLNLNSKNSLKALSHSSIPLRSNEFQNLPFPDQMPRTNKDIARPMLNLLTRCNDVVNNLTGVLGYIPYHSL